MVLAELGGKLRASLRKLQGGGQVTSQVVNELLADISRALIESDVNIQLVKTLKENVTQTLQPILEKNEQQRTNHQNVSKLVQRAVVDELTALLRPGGGGKQKTKRSTIRRGTSNVILFVGLQGAGKTTTIGKYAHYYSKKGFKVCMVCADTFRAGALDQLKQNATKLRIPFYGDYTVSDPVQIATAGVEQFTRSKYEIILVDTSGRHKQEAALLTEMQEVAAAIVPHQTILVVDATQGQAVYDQARAFHEATPVGSVILSKLDGNSKGGGALSAVAATQAPVSFTGSGEHFDDLEVFEADRFVSKLLGFGDLKGLMEAMKPADKKQQEQMMEKMAKGVFTLRDMYSQFEKILNMGPLNKIAGMIPGMPEYLVPKGGDQEATHRLRKFMVMMDSMNNAELDGKVDMHKKDDKTESRIRRIAAGSGCHPNEVKMLLAAHKQFEGMVSKMGKSMGGKGMSAAKQQQMMAQMRKNPNLINQRLNQMDPAMLKQMGGRESVMQMMQQMAKGGGGGMPDMSAMQAMMGGGMPNMNAMQAMMGGAGGGGGMPDLGGMDMESMMKMAQSMGMGPGGPMGGGRR